MVKIVLVDPNPESPVFEAYEVETEEKVECKNWFEKSKNKWHIVLGPNSANRKYIAHNEFFAKAVDGEYTVEDKTTGPRSLGTSQPDRHLVPYMTAEDKEAYDAIIARAIENRNAQKNSPESEIEKLQAKIDAYAAKIAELQAKA